MTTTASPAAVAGYIHALMHAFDPASLPGRRIADWLRYNDCVAGIDFAAAERAAGTKGFKAMPLKGAKASVSFDNAIRKHASKNVIGILPGSQRPEEIVLHTAHWDHLGRCEAAPDGDDICNGAIDNATGTAALVALAEAHAKAGAAPRTLAFLAVTAEESGLLSLMALAAALFYEFRIARQMLGIPAPRAAMIVLATMVMAEMLRAVTDLALFITIGDVPAS